MITNSKFITTKTKTKKNKTSKTTLTLNLTHYQDKFYKVNPAPFIANITFPDLPIISENHDLFLGAINDMIIVFLILLKFRIYRHSYYMTISLKDQLPQAVLF